MANRANASNHDYGARRIRDDLQYYSRRINRRWRMLTARKRMLPALIIAGAPKCGTTALYRYLLSHPQVLAPFPSNCEIGYFSENYKHGVDWYRAWFPLSMEASRASHRAGSKTVITCEQTPFYVMHPRAAERIAATLPDVRIIILLRNPVDRAYSHYQHEFRCGHETLSFRDAIAMEGQRIAGEVDRLQFELDYRSSEYARHAYLDQGVYRTKLERFFEHFNHANLMVINSERLFSHTGNVFDEVVRFLQLDRFKLSNAKAFNSGSYETLDRVDPGFAIALRKHFRPHNESLYSYLGTDFGW